MASTARRLMIWAAAALLSTGMSIAQAPAQSSGGGQAGIKTIDNPDGGHIYLGVLAGQPAPQEALGKTLHRLTVLCGDRPQLGRLVQNSSGEILAGFFTVTARIRTANRWQVWRWCMRPRAEPRPARC